MQGREGERRVDTRRGQVQGEAIRLHSDAGTCVTRCQLHADPLRERLAVVEPRAVTHAR